MPYRCWVGCVELGITGRPVVRVYSAPSCSMSERSIAGKVDGLDADKVREVMEIELGAMDARHQNNIAFWKALGGYAPTMGMVGTVIGLINMLGNLSDPAQLGAGLSVALLTTLYGVIFANLVFLPIGSKLARLHAAELTVKDMAIDGVIALQSGASPRAIVERLEAFLAPESRQGLDVRSGKKKAA